METKEELQKRIARARSRYNDEKYRSLYAQWDYKEHEVMRQDLRPDIRQVINSGGTRPDGTKEPERTEIRAVSRIATPIEQDIVGIHTAFAVGLDPDLGAEPRNENEKHMLELIEETNVRNRVRFLNQSAVSALLSETIVAEYWWSSEDADFYDGKPWAGEAKTRLRCELWSPFLGDKLVPEKNATGELIRFYRFYKIKDDSGRKVDRLMEIDDTSVILYELRGGDGWVLLSSHNHGFGKIPVVYMETDRSLCDPIQSKRARLELVQSNLADCLDENFYPKVLVRGAVVGVQKTGRTQVLELQGDSSVNYLTWEQATAAAEDEIERLKDECYAMTMTPRISPKDLQGLGSALSGVAFRYIFMGAHIAVRKHEKIVGAYLSRRYNFMKDAIARLVPAVSAGRSLRLNPTLTPFTIEDSAGIGGEEKEEAN